MNEQTPNGGASQNVHSFSLSKETPRQQIFGSPDKSTHLSGTPQAGSRGHAFEGGMQYSSSISVRLKEENDMKRIKLKSIVTVLLVALVLGGVATQVYAAVRVNWNLANTDPFRPDRCGCFEQRHRSP